MDFFEMLVQYEKNFEKKITDNLNIFKREVINYSNIKNNDINFDNIEEKNIKEIIKEISTSKILHQFLHSKYKLSNNNKYTIFAKDIKKKENYNYNNQKDINLNKIINIPIFKNNLIEEIKKTIFQNIKNKYLLKLNELLTVKKDITKNNLKININNENEENSLIQNLIPITNNQLFVPIKKKIQLNEKKIKTKNKTFRNENNNFGVSKDSQNINFKNIRMKRNKNKEIFLNNNKSSLISFLIENGGLEKNNNINNNNNNFDKTYVKNIHFLNKKNSCGSEKSISIDKKFLNRIESQGKITINKLKIKDLRKRINQNHSPKKIQDNNIKQPINLLERNNNLSIKLKGKRNLSSKNLIKSNYNIKKDKN